MNNELFNQAKDAYRARNYELALALYTQCLQDARNPLGPGETGQLYHQIGNCLVKLNNPTEAIQSYTLATGDAAYDACGAVNYNLGMAYASLHDFENAERHFEIAVSDRKYGSAYKAYAAMGNALMKMGKTAEAGVAYREAALDDANPDPTKSLLNLGVCFMALDRPADAASVYESALQLDPPADTKNRLYANLGQAYVAIGQMQKAVHAFEQALADQTYFLSDSARIDYQKAVGAVSQGASDSTQKMSPIRLGSDMSGLDVMAEPMADYEQGDGQYGLQTVDGYGAPYLAEGYEGDPNYQGQGSGDMFFTATDEEIEKWSRGIAKQDRKRRNVGLKALVVVIFLLVIAFGACIFMYTQGFGFPSQQTVISQLFDDPKAAVESCFADEIDATKASTLVELLVEDPEVVIDGMNKSMTETTAYVTAQTPQGGDVDYKISLVRSGVGWKISNIELYFASQN